MEKKESLVLNLIINGIPSIQNEMATLKLFMANVLNLIINGIPSILELVLACLGVFHCVLNLIINGIPSIPIIVNDGLYSMKTSFKPYYKWNTFNTLDLYKDIDFVVS